MTPQQTQRMMDFILRSQAGSVIRMERMEEKWKKWEERFQARAAKIQDQLDLLARETRELLKSQRDHERRMRELEASERRATVRLNSMKDVMKFLMKRLDVHSSRINHLERKASKRR
jgi:hypothetical protein